MLSTASDSKRLYLRAESAYEQLLFVGQACIVAVGGFRAYAIRCGVEIVAADHISTIDPSVSVCYATDFNRPSCA